MQDREIVGQKKLKEYFTETINKDRIPHAMLFSGPEGSGKLAMAMAYARMVLCKNKSIDTKDGNSSCNLKFDSFSHPDLHFIYPSITQEGKSKPKALDFIIQWRQFLADSFYGSLFDWYSTIGVENKQGLIRVEDAAEIIKIISLKPFEAGYKVIIIWMADKMNVEFANKILKVLEEPTDKTLLILITEKEEDILKTIISRCQVIQFSPILKEDVISYLVENKNVEREKAIKIATASQGNLNKAIKFLDENREEQLFDQWFVLWVRGAFRAKGNASAILDLIEWSEAMAKLGRETQKKFIAFCTEMFRQALLLNYQSQELVFYESTVEKFKLENFAPFINGNNILEIYKELQDASYHIERNANAKIVFTDLSIKLTRLLHKK